MILLGNYLVDLYGSEPALARPGTTRQLSFSRSNVAMKFTLTNISGSSGKILLCENMISPSANFPQHSNLPRQAHQSRLSVVVEQWK